jgi:MFS family permease
LLLGLVILGVFVVHQRRKLHPLIDFGLLLESRAFGFACLILVFLQGAIYAVPFVATLYLQYIQALSPQTTGFVLMLQAVSTAVIALFSGRLIGRVSSIKVIGTGIGVGLAGFLLIIFANSDYAFFLIPLGLVAIGICAGLVETPTINFMMGCVAGHQRGSASAAVNSARMFGSLIGISAISVLLSLTIGDAMITPAVYDALGLAVRDYFLIASVMILLCGASLFLARRSA